MPKRYLMQGDPYHCQCMKTGRLLRETLGLSKDKFMVCFQSRFGKAEWLQPYAQQTVEELPSKGVKKLLMITPGFASDCVETLEEVAIGLKETFEEAGVLLANLADGSPAVATHAEAATALSRQGYAKSEIGELVFPQVVAQPNSFRLVRIQGHIHAPASATPAMIGGGQRRMAMTISLIRRALAGEIDRK